MTAAARTPDALHVSDVKGPGDAEAGSGCAAELSLYRRGG